jgi:hypothetical protein
VPRRLALALTWLAATVVAVFVALQAVGAVGRQVTDRPTAVARQTSTTTVPQSATAPSTSTTLPQLDSALTPSSEATRGPVATAPVPDVHPAPAAPTPEPEPEPEPDSSGPSAPEPQATFGPTTTYNLQGGSIGVRCAGTTIELVYSSPAPGFTADVNSSGPQQVDVRFESDEHRSRINVQCPSGSPVVVDEREEPR